ncbi:hypothetical protein PIB30_065021 [Stylosanthes scabra]|uniref:Secreted protein n=1 Tax=Stylosanthes scabra TaxID=79078 RepID=A0ABU6YMP2_9FABA|nr:hypothetical protein [Stylosanthes scabra]
MGLCCSAYSLCLFPYFSFIKDGLLLLSQLLRPLHCLLAIAACWVSVGGCWSPRFLRCESVFRPSSVWFQDTTLLSFDYEGSPQTVPMLRSERLTIVQRTSSGVPSLNWSR